MTEPPLFVGGTGRSGTTIVARLLGKGSRYATLSRELKFHSHPGGLTDLLDGNTSLDDFCGQLRDRWWGEDTPEGASGGFLPMCSPRTFEPAVARFRENFTSDPLEAARTLMHELADPFAQRRRKTGWVEHTTTSVRDAGRLQRIFPQLRVVHVVRDGRDVAASLLHREWGPDEPMAALHYWADRLRAADRGAQALPRERLHVVHLEDLLQRDRDEGYRRLLRFAGLDDEPAVQQFFETVMTADAAHIGRWRELGAANRMDAEYAQILRRLRDEDVTVVDGLPAADREHLSSA